VNPEDIKLVLYSSDSLNGNWKFDYQQDAGGFSGYFNPLEISTYEITDVSTGKIFATGKIDPLAAVSVAQNNGHAMNLVLPVGVTEVKFVGENNFQSFSRQQLNGQVADCVEPPSVTPVYERVPLSTAEQILQMGAGRTLYKFRATAPYDADASINLVQFSTLAWSNSGLQLDFLSLYAYTDSDYSVPYIRFDPTGRVAPSSTANGYWALPSNERGKVSFEAVEGKDAFLTISAGTTLYFALRADISGFVPAIGACAFISTNMSGLSETVLYTHDECTTGGGMGAPIPSPTSPPVSGDCLEETLPAKVYFMDLEGWALDVYIYGLTEGNIEIRRWIPTGEMPVLVSEDFLSEYGTNASIKAGYGKVIVTITGVLRNPDDGFYINFQRSFLPANGGGMGGGKG
ncbi:MAG: hypothetical protein Q7R75_01785, partial [bacterium]|nr:hypothetical protein [bacterium]